MDIRSSLVAQNYAATKSATAPTAKTTAAGIANDFMATMRAGEQAAIGGMTGQTDPHTLVQALAQTELAVQTAVTVRDKVVEAYQEILRMPV